jgi:hypothetical protein
MINVIYYYRVDMVSRLIMVSRLFMASCLCLLGNQLKYTWYQILRSYTIWSDSNHTNMRSDYNILPFGQILTILLCDEILIVNSGVYSVKERILFSIMVSWLFMVSCLIMVSRLFMASCLCLLGNQLKYTKWLAEKQKIIFEHCIQFGINYNLIDIVFPQ